MQNSINFNKQRQTNYLRIHWTYHGNQLKSKNQRFFRTNLICCTAIPKRIAISQFRFQVIKQHASLYTVYNFADIRPRNPRVYAVNIAPFAAKWQKSAYHVKYLRISWTYLDLLYRFGKRVCMDDYPNVRLALAQGTLLWQPIKFRGQSQRSSGTTFFIASAFHNGLADCKSAFKRLNGNIRARSCTNLVNFRPVISEFTLLKRTVFAAIRPQFDDDLHSSPWHSETDWNIAILISAE